MAVGRDDRRYCRVALSHLARTESTLLRVNRDDLVAVAAWGVAVVFGGLFLVYTWTVIAAIVARERLGSTLKRSLSLADQALVEARRPDATRAE